MPDREFLARHSLSTASIKVPVPGNAPQTLAAVLERPKRMYPRTDAIVGRHRRYSYSELDTVVQAAAAGLASIGARVGDRVAASLPNDTEIVVAFLAAMRLGCIWVGINRNLATDEKSYILRESSTSILIAEASVAEEIENVRRDLFDLSHVVRVDTADAKSEWDLLLEHAPGDPPQVDIDPFAPAAIAYTSGTTGFPKGAVHSQHNLVIPGAVMAESGSYSQSTRDGVCLPLTILNLMILHPIATCQLGACCVLIDRLDPVGLAQWIREESIDVIGSVPAVYYDLLTHPQVNPKDLSTLTHARVGGTDCPEEFLDLFRKVETVVSMGYGSTEVPTAVTREAADDHVPGSSGVSLPHVRVEIVDYDRRPVPRGTIGEVCVRPASDGKWANVYTPMLGYWNQPEETAAVMDAGMLHTGDLGFLDEKGRLFIKGRKSDLIIRGGANIYPAEVERVLAADPRVVACAVVGRPDPRLGERVVAFAELVPGEIATSEELHAVCTKSLARYKVPSEIHILNHLPRNAMGKILKADLRERSTIEDGAVAWKAWTE